MIIYEKERKNMKGRKVVLQPLGFPALLPKLGSSLAHQARAPPPSGSATIERESKRNLRGEATM